MRIFFKILCAFLFVACAPSRHSFFKNHLNKNEKPLNLSSVDFVLVYIIHGDADYIYHDSSGHYHVADMEAVHEAKTVGLESKHGEIFIFHQKSGFRFFNHSPRGILYHYRNGHKLTQEDYTRSDIDLGFEFESKLFQSLHSPTSKFYLAYFGHKIPEANGQGYSSSFPKISFSLTEFSQGIKNLNSNEQGRTKPFNLIVLSTCQGGSLPTLKALSPLTDYLVASPANLHLSYLNTLAFIRDSSESQSPHENQKVFYLADSVAHQSFRQLQSFTQTEITVSLYDFSSKPDSIQVIDQLSQVAKFGSDKLLEVKP